MRSVYVSSAWSNKEWAKWVAHRLSENGYYITRAWWNHPFATGIDDFTDPRNVKEADEHARADMSAVASSSVFVLQTDIDASYSHGRMVELGAALMVCPEIWIIGPPENIFCMITGEFMGTKIRHFENVTEMLDFALLQGKKK